MIQNDTQLQVMQMHLKNFTEELNELEGGGGIKYYPDVAPELKDFYIKSLAYWVAHFKSQIDSYINK